MTSNFQADDDFEIHLLNNGWVLMSYRRLILSYIKDAPQKFEVHELLVPPESVWYAMPITVWNVRSTEAIGHAEKGNIGQDAGREHRNGDQVGEAAKAGHRNRV